MNESNKSKDDENSKQESMKETQEPPHPQPQPQPQPLHIENYKPSTKEQYEEEERNRQNKELEDILEKKRQTVQEFIKNQISFYENYDENSKKFRSGIVDSITNRKNIKARANERNKIKIAVKQTEEAFCDALNELIGQNISKLETILIQEVIENFFDKSTQNTIQGVVEKIIGDILNDQDTIDTLIKHIRGGCFKDDNIEGSILKKQKILEEIKERKFQNELNSSIGQMEMKGGLLMKGVFNLMSRKKTPSRINKIFSINKPSEDKDQTNTQNEEKEEDTPKNDEESVGEIDIDSEDIISNYVCFTYKKLFDSWTMTLKSNAKDAIDRSIRGDKTIQTSLFKMIVSIIKIMFDAKKFKEVFVEKLEGGCHKRIKPEPGPTLAQQPIGLPEIPLPQQAFAFGQIGKLPEAPPSAPKPFIGGRASGFHTKKNPRKYKHKTFKRQRGGGEPMMRLSFSNLVNSAFPNIKACMCEKIKIIYGNSTPQIFDKYSGFFYSVINNPEIIDHTKVLYEDFLDKILHTSNPQIKLDIRDHVLGKCPPIADPELKFTGDS